MGGKVIKVIGEYDSLLILQKQFSLFGVWFVFVLLCFVFKRKLIWEYATHLGFIQEICTSFISKELSSLPDKLATTVTVLFCVVLSDYIYLMAKMS